jgi:exodeoxyribonuclease VII large subunit
MQNRLAYAVRTPLNQARFSLAHLRTRLATQLPDTNRQRSRLNDVARRLGACAASQATHRRQALVALTSQLELLNPQRTLERGYAIVLDSKGKVVRAPKDLHARDTVTVRLAEGAADVGIATVQATLE